MRTLVFCAVSIFALSALAEPYKVEPGACLVETVTGEWVDDERNDRIVPWRLYLPGCDEFAPVVFVSHGLGGSRDGYQYLGQHLASHGYAAVHIQHTGSDLTAYETFGRERVIEMARARAPESRAAGVGRFGDVAFAIRQIKTLNRDGKYRGRFDTSAMGIAGHSAGAIGTLVSAGALPPQDRIGERPGHQEELERSFSSPELRGALALSPSPLGDNPAATFANMLMPIFHVTGSRDDSPVLALTPEDRQIPFQVIENVDQYLLVLNDAVHSTFSGRAIDTDPMLKRHHEVVRMVAVAFWDEVLRDSDEARFWLRRGGLSGELQALDVFEWKPATK